MKIKENIHLDEVKEPNENLLIAQGFFVNKYPSSKRTI